MDRIVVGMSGASGIAYGVRLLEALKEQPIETHFVATDSARLVHQHECDGDWANVEALAVKEAIKLNIPIVAIVDTNSDPTGINFPIPGNDDARRSINLYCELVKETVLDAQKQITQNSEEESKPEIKLEESKIKVKELVLKPKAKIDVIKKKSKSIISKIRNLASKKK